MRLLLDTHTLLWLLIGSPRLSHAARAAIDDASNEKLFSVVSCWKITIKVSLGKRSLQQPLAAFLAQLENDPALRQLPIRSPHLLRLAASPHHHRDPFDRLIVAQALSEGCTLVSADPKLDAYGVARLW